ncbi:MAG: hypothetical protein KatS3mg101_0888 [Patescibacteria group bacterium]|nr:MAG: hypothetical protein KatS3mg101_0888 [Patescibacteria group bacterium]
MNNEIVKVIESSGKLYIKTYNDYGDPVFIEKDALKNEDLRKKALKFVKNECKEEVFKLINVMREVRNYVDGIVVDMLSKIYIINVNERVTVLTNKDEKRVIYLGIFPLAKDTCCSNRTSDAYSRIVLKELQHSMEKIEKLSSYTSTCSFEMTKLAKIIEEIVYGLQNKANDLHIEMALDRTKITQENIDLIKRLNTEKKIFIRALDQVSGYFSNLLKICNGLEITYWSLFFRAISKDFPLEEFKDPELWGVPREIKGLRLSEILNGEKI